MANSYRVTALYVVPKVRDPLTGGFHHRGFSQHAIIAADEIDAGNLQHHLDIGMMEPIEEPEAESESEPEPANAEEAAEAEAVDADISEEAEATDESPAPKRARR
jgi:hypothetical protein